MEKRNHFGPPITELSVGHPTQDQDGTQRPLPHVVTPLIAKRAEIAGHIEHLQGQVRQLTVALDHVEETLRLFAPEIDKWRRRPPSGADCASCIPGRGQPDRSRKPENCRKPALDQSDHRAGHAGTQFGSERRPAARHHGAARRFVPEPLEAGSGRDPVVAGTGTGIALGTGAVKNAIFSQGP